MRSNRELTKIGVMKKTIATCFVFLMLIVSVRSENLAEIKAKAEQGDALSQAILGQCYRYGGLGLPVDKEQARKWINISAGKNNPLALAYKADLDNDRTYDKKALDAGLVDLANAGNTRAQHLLGYFYATGTGGLAKDTAEAFKWYKMLATEGDDQGQSNLGVCYANAIGVEEDLVEAFKWFRKSAEKNADGQINVGICYENGLGVKKDPIEAAKWFRKAATNSDEEARSTAKKALVRLHAIE